MQTIEYTTIDKSTWGEGPWQGEPDKRQWLDEATGLPCLIVRVPHSGALCGYVGVPPEHAFHGVEYNKTNRKVRKLFRRLLKTDATTGKRGPTAIFCLNPKKPRLEVLFDVHGSLTFSGGCRDNGDESKGICHVASGADKVWWFGFDCAHCDDVSPAMDVRLRELGVRTEDMTLPGAGYRTVDYVADECRSLAGQLKTIVGKRHHA